MNGICSAGRVVDPLVRSSGCCLSDLQCKKTVAAYRGGVATTQVRKRCKYTLVYSARRFGTQGPSGIGSVRLSATGRGLPCRGAGLDVLAGTVPRLERPAGCSTGAGNETRSVRRLKCWRWMRRGGVRTAESHEHPEDSSESYPLHVFGYSQAARDSVPRSTLPDGTFGCSPGHDSYRVLPAVVYVHRRWAGAEQSAVERAWEGRSWIGVRRVRGHAKNDKKQPKKAKAPKPGQNTASSTMTWYDSLAQTQYKEWEQALTIPALQADPRPGDDCLTNALRAIGLEPWEWAIQPNLKQVLDNVEVPVFAFIQGNWHQHVDGRVGEQGLFLTDALDHGKIAKGLKIHWMPIGNVSLFSDTPMLSSADTKVSSRPKKGPVPKCIHDPQPDGYCGYDAVAWALNDGGAGLLKALCEFINVPNRTDAHPTLPQKRWMGIAELVSLARRFHFSADVVYSENGRQTLEYSIRHHDPKGRLVLGFEDYHWRVLSGSIMHGKKLKPEHVPDDSDDIILAPKLPHNTPLEVVNEEDLLDKAIQAAAAAVVTVPPSACEFHVRIQVRVEQRVEVVGPTRLQKACPFYDCVRCNSRDRAYYEQAWASAQVRDKPRGLSLLSRCVSRSDSILYALFRLHAPSTRVRTQSIGTAQCRLNLCRGCQYWDYKSVDERRSSSAIPLKSAYKLDSAFEEPFFGLEESDRLLQTLHELESAESLFRAEIECLHEVGLRKVARGICVPQFSTTYGEGRGPSKYWHFGDATLPTPDVTWAFIGYTDIAYECSDFGLRGLRFPHQVNYVYGPAMAVRTETGWYHTDSDGRSHACCAPLDTVEYIDYGMYHYRLKPEGVCYSRGLWFSVARLVTLETFHSRGMKPQLRGIHRKAPTLTGIGGPDSHKLQTLLDCAGMAKRLPEDKQYVVNIVRQHLAANDYPHCANARDIVGDALARNRLEDEIYGVVGHAPFSMKRRTYRSCYGCGKEPRGKYRWKHRMCPECSKRQHGSATSSGRMVAMGFDPGKAVTGTIHVPGSERPPKLKKWELVEVLPDEITIPGSWVGDSARRVSFTPDMLAKVWSLQPQDSGRERVRLNAIGVSGANVMVSSSTRYNQLKALCGRAFLKRPLQPDSETWLAAQRLSSILLPLPFDAPIMPLDEWIRSMPSRRRKALERAKIRYEQHGLQDRDLMFKSFVKSEKLPDFTVKDGILMPLDSMSEANISGTPAGMIDRLINGPEDVAHIVAGPAIKPQLSRLKEQWHFEHCLFYASVEPQKLTAWLNRVARAGRIPFWCDFAMFDRTHSRLSWDFVERLYRQIPGLSSDFWKVLLAWRRPRGTMGPIRFRAHTMNASGRDDTALANAVLNGVCMLLSVSAALHGVAVRELTEAMVLETMREVDIAVCGDDTLGFMPQRPKSEMAEIIRRVGENIALFGFSAKLDYSECLWKAVFLGMRPAPVGDHLEWAKTAGRAIYKLGWKLDPSGDGAAWAHGVHEAMARAYCNTPVLYEICRKYCSLRVGAKKTPVLADANKPWDFSASGFIGTPWDGQTLQAFCDAYSAPDRGVTLTPAAVMDCIAEIDRIDTVPMVLDHWVLRHLIATDDL